jgi:hypothetical protein
MRLARGDHRVDQHSIIVGFHPHRRFWWARLPENHRFPRADDDAN